MGGDNLPMLRLRFAAVGPRGPKPGLAFATASASTKAIKESAARALQFIHPQTGTVWKPRHVFVESSHGFAELRDVTELQNQQIVWAEHPQNAGEVLKRGLTQRRNWGLRERCSHGLLHYQEPLRSMSSCCVGFGALNQLLMSRRYGAVSMRAPRGAGSKRKAPETNRGRRPTHFVSLRVGEDIRKIVASVQEQLLRTTREEFDIDAEQMLNSSLIPCTKLHLSMIILALEGPHELTLARECMEHAVKLFQQDLHGERFKFRLIGLDSFGERVLFAQIDDLSQSLLHLFYRRLEKQFSEQNLRVVCRSAILPSDSSGESSEKGAYDNDIKLSRYLGKVLRHQAVQLGLSVRSDGSVRVDELLALPFFTNRHYKPEHVEAAVSEDQKQRFALWKENGVLRIRANQGHTMKIINDDELLVPILNASEVSFCIHGTYNYRWNRQSQSRVDVWELIKKEGLKTMGRNHIHFVPHEIGAGEVISGMRADSEVAIYIDIDRALERGIKFYRSANDVILTRGDENGCIPPSLFEKVVEIRTGRLLWPEDGNASDQRDQQPHASKIDASDSGSEAEIAGNDHVGPPSRTFRPHVTIAKTSRARNRRARIPRSVWEPLRDTAFGIVTPGNVELCAMKADAANVYYEVEHVVAFK